MRCSELMERLESFSPLSYAESWDNVGLLCGRKEKEVETVMIALDPTAAVIDQAVAAKADFLLTHHPLIFSPVKKVTSEDFIGRRMLHLIRNDICYYAMHTNFDVMGMADAVADDLNLKKRSVLDITYEDEISKEGIGRVGYLPRIMSLKECGEYCKEIFKLEHVTIFGDLDMAIETAAVVPGSGKDFVKQALQKKADVLITGDIGHHNGIDAMEQGMSIIDAGHYGLEKTFIPYMAEAIKRELPHLNVLIADEQTPFSII